MGFPQKKWKALKFYWDTCKLSAIGANANASTKGAKPI